MSSSPETDADLTVTVKRVAGGLVSNWLLDNVTTGDVVEATRPAGVFCPQPVRAPDRRLLRWERHHPGHVDHQARPGDDDAAGPAPLRQPRPHLGHLRRGALGAALPATWSRLEVRHHIDAEAGYLGPDDVAAFVGGDVDADFYICGPGPFMDLVESGLIDLGVEADRIFIERFLVEQQEKDAAAVSRRRASGDPEAVPDEVTVTLAGKTAVIHYQKGDTVLETARRGGLRPPFSCEAGNCANLHGLLEGRIGHHAGEQRADARRGRRGLDPYVPVLALGQDGDRRVRGDVSWREGCDEG